MTKGAHAAAEAALVASYAGYCSEYIECRYWDEEAAHWLPVPTVDSGGDERGVRCEARPSDPRTDTTPAPPPLSCACNRTPTRPRLQPRAHSPAPATPQVRERPPDRFHRGHRADLVG